MHPQGMHQKNRGRGWVAALAGLLALSLPGTSPGPALAAAGNQEITLTAADGQKLRGLLGRGAKDNGAAVVLLPMYGQGKETWQPLLQVLNARGFTTLALDLRGQGGSRTAPDGSDLAVRVAARDPALFKEMHLDAEAGIRYLLGQGVTATRLGLVGASVGCSVALDALTRGEVPVRAAVVLTPGRDYLGIPTMAQINNWPGTPLLILSSEEEAVRGATPISQQLQGKGAELRTFAQTEIHGTHMFGKVAGVEQLIADWLAAKLGEGKQP